MLLDALHTDFSAVPEYKYSGPSELNVASFVGCSAAVNFCRVRHLLRLSSAQVS